jgi:pimeloyl-ACP methyl ester carboxylesterase
VASVLEGSAAAAAGVLEGDVVEAIDGEVLDDALHLLEVARSRRSGDVISFRTVREGVKLDLAGVAPPLPTESSETGDVHLGAVEACGHRLRTIVNVPRTPGPHPAILYLQGLRCRSCEYPLDPGATLRRLVDGWTRAGFLVLRVERSGVGDSEGPPCSRTDLDVELDGYLAGIDHLLGRPDVDPRRVLLFGQSFGAMTAPLLALERALAGILVYGASGARWHDCVVDTSRRQRLLAGVAEAQVEAEVALWAELHALVCREGWTPALAFERRPHLAALRSIDCVGETLWGRHGSLYQQLDALDLFSVWSAVGRSGVPVVVGRGEYDWICTREEAEAIVRAVGSTGRYEEIARTGHDGLSYESFDKSRQWGEGRWDGRVVDATVSWIRSGGQTFTSPQPSGNTQP